MGNRSGFCEIVHVLSLCKDMGSPNGRGLVYIAPARSTLTNPALWRGVAWIGLKSFLYSSYSL